MTEVKNNQSEQNDGLPARFGALTITDDEFETIRSLIYKQFGINLTDQKRSLVVGRLQKLMRTLGFTTFMQYLNYLENDKTKNALGELINRISTNHTFFFREKSHFDFFSNVTLPQTVERLKRGNSKDLRIWCAGCATGEEAYTLVMLLFEFFGTQYGAWDAGLLATDISTAALGTAQAGVYPAERTTLIPKEYLRKYFNKTPAGDWVVQDRLKKEIVYRRFNFMNEQFPFKKPFSAIFCRNVMIYFDQPTRDALVRRFYNHTEPGGYLFIGHAESLRRDSCPYEYVEPAIYRKREA